MLKQQVLRWVLYSSVGLILSACVAPPSQPEQMEMGIPAQLPTWQAKSSDLSLELIPSMHWQAFFIDPQLQTLIVEALQFNSDLKGAAARVAEARALYGIYVADQSPHFGLQAEGLRGRLPADLSVTQEANTSGQYQIGLGVSAFELDFWGRVSSLSDSALAQYLATEYAMQSFELSVIAMTANAYFQAVELTERVLLAQKTVASRTESFRIMQERVRLGGSSDLELRSVESLLLTARSELAKLEREKAQNAIFIQQLTGTSLQVNEDSLTLANQQLDRMVKPDMSSRVLLGRPDVRAAEQQLIAARANVEAARAAFFPRITLTALGGTASAELNGLFRGGSGIWSFVPQISLPIFDGGARESNLALAEARKHGAVAHYESVVRTAFKEVADALAAQHWLLEQEKEQSKLVHSETERARLATVRYEQGSAPYLDVLDAQRSLFAAQQLLLQLQRIRLSNMVALYQALGDGKAVQ